MTEDGPRRVYSGSPYETSIGFCRALRIGRRILVGGTAPIWPDGSCDPDPEVQAQRCIEIIASALRELGASLDDVVRTRLFLTAVDHLEPVARAHRVAFGAIEPVSTAVVVSALLDPRWCVEIEAEAEAEPPAVVSPSGHP